MHHARPLARTKSLRNRRNHEYASCPLRQLDGDGIEVHADRCAIVVVGNGIGEPASTPLCLPVSTAMASGEAAMLKGVDR